MDDPTSTFINKQTFSLICISMAFSYSIYMLGLCQQHEIHCILAYGLTAFAAYAVFMVKKPSLHYIFLAGLVARLLLVHSFPGLSDDIFRFVWDGRLTAAGFNPYGYLPSEVVGQELPRLGTDLFSKLNSPNYFTIYPPVSQFVFLLSTLVGDDLYMSSILMKVIFLIAEIATFIGIYRLLDYLGKPSHYAALYWLNPLIIIEGMGNLHFEILMIAFLVWAIYFLFVKEDRKKGAVFFSLSIASKLLPLMFLPFMFFRFGDRERFEFFKYLIISCLVLFIPIFFGLQILNFGSSVDLYFQKFEFNASLYYILRHIGEMLSGYNLIYYIGPLLGVTTVLLIIKTARLYEDIDLMSFLYFCLISFTLYLFLATTVHPWYLCLPILFSVFTRFVYTLGWSALALLTYVNYSYIEFSENMWIVAFEYSIVLMVLIYEYTLHISNDAKPLR